jgi:RHS repeat-associated protein
VKDYQTTFTYVADGIKASAVDSAGKGFIYLGTMVYSKEFLTKTLESASFAGGRINRTGANSYDINYFITDHLGSTRVIVDNNGEIKEQKDFYPFGKEHENSDLITSTNRYTFSGKEKQIVGEVNFLDFSNRMYDDFICRWTTQDPLQEKFYSWSSYNYCMDNPVNNVDPDGRFAFAIPLVPVIIKAAVTAITAVTATVVAKHAYDKHRESRKEKEKRERDSRREDVDKARKHKDMIDNHVGKPSSDGTPDPKGGGGIKGKITTIVGTTGIAAKIIGSVLNYQNKLVSLQ